MLSAIDAYIFILSSKVVTLLYQNAILRIFILKFQVLPQYLFAFTSSAKLSRPATSRTGGWRLGVFFIIKHVLSAYFQELLRRVVRPAA
jgi:hypothetical protein